MDDISRDQLTRLLRGAAAGEQARLGEIYDLTAAKLFGVCLRILKTREDAEDVLQEVYVNVWQRAASFDPAKARPMTWLIAVARNRSIDRLRSVAARRADRSIDENDTFEDEAVDALTGIERSQEHARLRGCLDGLEMKSRDAIRAAFFGGSTYEALAKQSAVPIGTMKTWVRRGLIALRECLER